MSGLRIKIAAGRVAGLAVAAALALCAASATGQTAPVSYPPSRALGDIAVWLQRDTPLAPSQVVDVSPSAVTAVTSAAPMGETRGFLAAVSSEAMDPDIPNRDGIASWSIPIEVDCERRAVRLGAMTGYPGRDLRTDPRIVRAADTNWVNPTPSAPLGAVLRALCDRDFQRPLAPRAKTTTPSRPQASGPLPKIVVRPARPPKADLAAAAAAAPAAPGASAEGPPGSNAAPAEAAKATVAGKTKREPSPPKTILIPGPGSAPPAGPTAVGATPAADEAAPPTAKPKPKPIKTGSSPWVAQIGASPSLPDIQGQLDRFKKKFSADLQGLDAHVVTVQVEGKTVNRALVSGFAGLSDAETFCKRLQDAGRPCLVRR